jgi:branched-chain amino acid transport system permease protein
MRTETISRVVIGVLIAAVALGIPFALPGYQMLNYSYALIFSIAILGLNILTGYSGQISLGHGAFLAIGAYGSAIAQQKFGINYLVSVPLAGILCGVLGFGFGFPALRLEGIYLALATFALAVAAPTVLKKPEAITGGVRGIILPPVTSPLPDLLSDDQYFYLLCLGVAVLCFLVAWNILRGRTGRAFRAIRDGDLAAVAFGVNLALYKTLAFGISAALAGIAGALYGIASGYLTPDAYGFQISILMLVGAVIGGLGMLEGAILGGLFSQFLSPIAQQALGNVNKQVANAAPTVTQGILLLIVMLVARQGVAGLIRTRYAQLMVRLRAVREEEHKQTERL